MARDRDPGLAERVRRAAQAAADAQRIAAAWDNYVTAGGALAAIRPCNDPWPPSLADLEPVPCQLLAGHDGPHRHRMRGTSVTVDW